MWIPPRDPSLLDFKNAIFVLIGRSPNLGVPTCLWQSAYAQALSLGSQKSCPLSLRAQLCAVHLPWHAGSMPANAPALLCRR